MKLDGKFFSTPLTQGVVRGQIDDSQLYMVSVLLYGTEDISHNKIVSISDMLSWHFFDDIESMQKGTRTTNTQQ